MSGLLIVRPDTRPRVGLGHLARSLAIAAAWQSTGGQVRIFVDPGSDGDIDPRSAEMIAASGLPPAQVVSECHAAGLAPVVGPTEPDWIILDGYAFSVDQQRQVRALGRLLVVDDQASLRHYDADFVLDQNAMLPGVVHEGIEAARVLRGLAYVCLRPDALSSPSPPRDGLIALLAGGDPKPPTREIIRSLAKADTGALRLIAMPWAYELQGPKIEHRSFAAPLRHNLDGVSVAVAPAGSTAWELCALGVPSVLFATTPNQEPVGAAVHAAGAGLYVGSITSLDPASVARRATNSLRLLSDDPGRRAAMAASGRTLIDGRGAGRVVAQLRSAQLELRPVSWDDVDLLFEWANDPVVRAMAFSNAPITRGDHENWLQARLTGGSGPHWIATLNGKPIGQVRFDGRGDDYEISVNLAKGARGLRLAAPLIIAGSRALVAETHGKATCYAQIKTSNRASLAAFEVANYTSAGYRSGPAPIGALGQTEPGASAEGNTVAQLRWSENVSPH